MAAIDPREALLQQWNGRVALGLLGVSPTAPLPTSPRAARRLWSEFGAFLAVGLKDAKASTAVLESVTEQIKAVSRQPSEITLGPWRGISLGGEKVSISLLARDSNLLMIFGRGELERFRRVQRGKFPSWSGAARHPLERSIGEDTEGWLKVAASMGRIARAARRRGVPDTIVSMVRSVAAVAGRVQVDADGFEFALELRPREARP